MFQAFAENKQLPQAAILLLCGMTTIASLAAMGHAEESAENPTSGAQEQPQPWQYAVQHASAQNG